MTGNRDELWKAAWETFYDASYYEVLFTEVMTRWQSFDFVARLLVSLTASSSAIAGWALWNDDDYKALWVLFAGVASVLSIIHTTLNATEKLKKYSKLLNDMTKVTLDCETFRHELSIYPEFDVDKAFKKHQKLRSDLQKALSGYSSDLMDTKGLQNKSQKILNNKLGIKGN